jgi:hypothetical protein
MGVQISEVSFTSATAGRGDHEVHDRHVVALGEPPPPPPPTTKQQQQQKHCISQPMGQQVTDTGRVKTVGN